MNQNQYQCIFWNLCVKGALVHYKYVAMFVSTETQPCACLYFYIFLLNFGALAFVSPQPTTTRGVGEGGTLSSVSEVWDAPLSSPVYIQNKFA